MRAGKKITLGDAEAQRDHWVMFSCEGSPANRNCSHSGKARVCEMIARLGRGLRLDEIPARCSSCGGDRIEVRSRPQHHVGGNSTGPIDPQDL